TEFQQRLLGARISVEHSGTGAALAIEKSKELGMPLAFAIAGHHAGLANCVVGGPGLPTPLKERLEENKRTLEKVLALLPPEILNLVLPDLPDFLTSGTGQRRNELN